MLTTVLFDLDGTLTDPKEGITRCIQHALVQLGAEPPPAEQLEWCIGPPLKESFAKILNTIDPAKLDEAVELYRVRFSVIGLFENILYPDIIPALRKIQASGLGIMLATSKPRVFAAKIMDHFQLTPFFAAIYGSELDGRLGDKAELIAHILKENSLDPQHTMMIGDRSHDIIGGKKNGTMTAGVSYGYGSLSELTESRPDFIFHSLAELTDKLVSRPLAHETRSV